MTVKFLTTPTIHQFMIDSDHIDFYDVLNLSAINKVSRLAFNSYYNWRNWQFKCIILKHCNEKDILASSKTDKKYIQIGLGSRVLQRSKQKHYCSEHHDCKEQRTDLAVSLSFGPTRSAFRDALICMEGLAPAWFYTFLMNARLPDSLDELKAAISLAYRCEPSKRNEALRIIAWKLVTIHTPESLNLMDILTPEFDKPSRTAIGCALAYKEGKKIAGLLKNLTGCDDTLYKELITWRISCTDPEALEESLEIACFFSHSAYFFEVMKSIINSPHARKEEDKLRVAAKFAARNATHLLKGVNLLLKESESNSYISLERVFSSLFKVSPDPKKQIFQILGNLTANEKRHFFDWLLGKHVTNIVKVSSYDLKLLSFDLYNGFRLPKLLTLVDKNAFSIVVPAGSSFAETVHRLLNNFSHRLTNDDIYNVCLSNYQHSLGESHGH